MSAEADGFLRDHLWGVLVTTRSTGAPQATMVAYDWNGTDLVISCRASAAKFVNASARPEVAFVVTEGIACCTVSGLAVCEAAGDGRDAATARVRDRLRDDAPWAAAILDDDIAAGLDHVRRATITVTPTKVHFVQPRS